MQVILEAQESMTSTSTSFAPPYSNAGQEYPNNPLWNCIYYGKEDSKAIELVYLADQQTQPSFFTIEFLLHYFPDHYQL